MSRWDGLRWMKPCDFRSSMEFKRKYCWLKIAATSGCRFNYLVTCQFRVLAAGVTPAAVGFTNAKLTLSVVGHALTFKTPGLAPGLALKEKFTMSVASTPGAATVTVAPAAPAAMSAVVIAAVPL